MQFANIRLGLKGLAGTNTLAYFAPPSTTKKKSLTTRPNKLEGLYLESLSSQVLEFEGKARA